MPGSLGVPPAKEILSSAPLVTSILKVLGEMIFSGRLSVSALLSLRMAHIYSTEDKWRINVIRSCAAIFKRLNSCKDTRLF